MFPYQLNNGFGNNPYPYPINPEMFRNMHPQVNPYISPPPFYPNFIPQTAGQFNYYPLMNHRPYQNEKLIPNTKNEVMYAEKKKRITKRLTQLDLRKQIRQHYKQYKAKRKSFKYFDPSRAPPITSLRNQYQIEIDCKNKQKQLECVKSQQQFSKRKLSENIKKLQILLQQPNMNDYPFLICKKRKYYRNLKRRYSVAYFQQRAFYITNKMPIPAQLHPKNKVRKSRSGVKNQNGDIQYSSSYDKSSQSNSQSLSSQRFNQQQCMKIELKKQQKNERELELNQLKMQKKMNVSQLYSSKNYE